jgi:hypothetical protein
MIYTKIAIGFSFLDLILHPFNCISPLFLMQTATLSQSFLHSDLRLSHPSSFCLSHNLSSLHTQTILPAPPLATNAQAAHALTTGTTTAHTPTQPARTPVQHAPTALAAKPAVTQQPAKRAATHQTCRCSPVHSMFLATSRPPSSPSPALLLSKLTFNIQLGNPITNNTIHTRPATSHTTHPNTVHLYNNPHT